MNEIEDKIAATENPDYVVAKIMRSEMSKYFDMVRNKNDWRGPIQCYVEQRDLAMVLLAIDFFTGTPGIINRAFDSNNVTKIIYRVDAIGYGAGPCGP